MTYSVLYHTCGLWQTVIGAFCTIVAIEVSRLQQRQAESAATPISSPASSTRPVSPNSSFGGVLSDYWFVCLVLVVVTVVGCVFLCGCMVRKKRRQGRLHISQTQLQR